MSNNEVKSIRLAVLLSGGGRTLDNLIIQIREGELPARIELVISSSSTAMGLKKATDAGIQARAISKTGKTIDQFSREITAELDNVKPDLVCLAGFMCFYTIPDPYLGKVMNVHPALLPAFGGKGMYGHFVHQAVLDAGCKISGCTVHFADNVYDHGPIIIQRAIRVLEEDTADTLADRVFEEEKIAYPHAINLFAQGRLQIIGKRVRIL
ncbi:MAG: phosphoribosylglycinamide formyltransferase [Phycisphaerae bacterium]